MPTWMAMAVGDGRRCSRRKRRGRPDGWPPLALTGGGDTVGGVARRREWLADELAEGEGDGEGEGDRDGEWDGEGDGDGEGVGVPEEGSAWHTLSVFVLAASGPPARCPGHPGSGNSRSAR